MPAYIHIVFENIHTHTNVRLTTAASETEGVVAVSRGELQLETKSHRHHFAGVQRTDYVLLPLSRPPGMPRERGCCEAQRPGRAAGRLRAAAARQAARDAERARRESEAAVKRSDLANFDPATPLEKLRWAREMQRNFQQPMSARTMRLCTVCSERWDTAEDGGGDHRWVVYHVSREHRIAAVGFHLGGRPRNWQRSARWYQAFCFLFLFFWM